MIYCTLNWLHMTNIGLSSSSGGLWGSLKCTAVKFADDCTNMIIAEDECQIESEMMKPMIVYVQGDQKIRTKSKGLLNQEK